MGLFLQKRRKNLLLIVHVAGLSLTNAVNYSARNTELYLKAMFVLISTIIAWKLKPEKQIGPKAQGIKNQTNGIAYDSF